LASSVIEKDENDVEDLQEAIKNEAHRQRRSAGEEIRVLRGGKLRRTNAEQKDKNTQFMTTIKHRKTRTNGKGREWRSLTINPRSPKENSPACGVGIGSLNHERKKRADEGQGERKARLS